MTARKAAGCPAAWPMSVVQWRLGRPATLFPQGFGHIEVMLQRWKGFAGPVLQRRVIAAFSVALEQRDRVLVGADLYRIEIGTEVLAALAFQLVELALVRAIERGRQLGLDLAAGDEPLEFCRGLGVVADHLRRKRFLRRGALVLSELARVDFEQVGDRDLLDEIGR